MYSCMCGMCIWIEGPAEARRGEQELELKEVTSHPRWVLETQLRSSGRAGSVFNH